MEDKKNIYLIGPMGAGKSTIGKRLARKLKYTFYDSDNEIENRTGVQIALIFDIEGEEGFRIREKRIIEELTGLNEIVLATGGGAVLDKENRELLSSHGIVIYLSAGLTQLINRTIKDKKRPLLDTEDRESKIRELMELREPLYQETANFVVKTDRKSIKKIVDEICKLTGKQ